MKGKVALVTGGGRGIGQGIVKRLAEAGCDIAVVDSIEENAKKVADEVKAMGRRAIAIKVDVSKWDQVQNMVRETIDKLGSLDIAVNNAGVISIMPVKELNEQEWDSVTDVNAKGVFFLLQSRYPAYEEAGLGPYNKYGVDRREDRIPGPRPLHGIKVRGRGFHQRPCQGTGKTGITVNAICPGIVGTQMWYGPTGLAEKWKQPGETMDESWKRHQETLIPQGVAQTPEDMGDLAVYFATSPHVTGQAIAVEGGMTVG